MLNDESTVKSTSDWLHVSSLLNFLLWAAKLYCLLLLLSKSFNATLFALFLLLLSCLCKSPGANCKGYSSSLSAVPSLFPVLYIIFLLLDLGNSLFCLNFSFSEMLTFESKLSTMSSFFTITFLCNTLILLDFIHYPIITYFWTITWTFSSQKSLILPVPPRWDIFLTRTWSTGYLRTISMLYVFILPLLWYYFVSFFHLFFPFIDVVFVGSFYMAIFWKHNFYWKFRGSTKK